MVTGAVVEVTCGGYMIDESDNIHQTFFSRVQLEEIQEHDAIILFEDEIVDLEWKRTRWADDSEISCGSMLGSLSQGWDGSVATYMSGGIWVADGQYMPDVLELGADLPDCGEADLAARQREDLPPEEPEEPSDPVPGDTDELDEADSGDNAISTSGCTHAPGRSLGGLALSLMVLGVLRRREH
ncbi:MAG TPA: hypothetical protein DFR83_03850 [Deltaproteobacteria bacterium]|nr:hypothetical protein [Deltaproteobacteria bacterium]